MLSPLWLAVKVHFPALTKVRVNPETVQTLVVLEVTVTVKPSALVLAERVYGNWVLVKVAGGLKVIACDCLVKVMDFVIDVAAA